MTITKERNGSTLTISLEDSLDTLTAPELEAELKTCLDGVEKLIFDFKKLNYISSAGLRAMVQAYKQMDGKGTMKIIHASEIVKEVFELVGLTETMCIE